MLVGTRNSLFTIAVCFVFPTDRDAGGTVLQDPVPGGPQDQGRHRLQAGTVAHAVYSIITI